MSGYRDLRYWMKILRPANRKQSLTRHNYPPKLNNERYFHGIPCFLYASQI
jgi:hypothetical protein